MATYRSTDTLNVIDTTTGTQDVRVKRLALFVQENTNSKIASIESRIKMYKLHDVQ